MRRLITLGSLALAAPLTAQTTITPGGIRSGNVTIGRNGTNVVNMGGEIINGNSQRRTVRCRGGGLTVNGNGNFLTVTGCEMVTVNGDKDSLIIGFGREGLLTVNGNGNRLSWSAPAGASVTVTNNGAANVVQRR